MIFRVMDHFLSNQLNTTFTVPQHLLTWIPGKTPLSTWSTVFGILAGYIATVLGLQAVMADQKPYHLNTIFRVYNLALSFGSLGLLLVMLKEAFPLVFNHGPIYSICSEAAWTSELEFSYIIDYYTKYVELLDTVFTILRKKHLSSLHVYHHAATVVLLRLVFDTRNSLTWPMLSLNLFSHVFLYYYFYASATGGKIWWKKYLPWMQVAQFAIDCGIGLIWGYSRLLMPYTPHLPQIDTCAGNAVPSYLIFWTLVSYLVLFFNHYFQPFAYLRSLIVMAEIQDLIP